MDQKKEFALSVMRKNIEAMKTAVSLESLDCYMSAAYAACDTAWRCEVIKMDEEQSYIVEMKQLYVESRDRLGATA